MSGNELVPMHGGLEPHEIDWGTVFENMQQVLQQSIASMVVQNLSDAREAMRRAELLYVQAQAGGPSPQLVLLGVLKQLVYLYASFTKVLILQVEGQFSKALEELGKALELSDEAISIIQEYKNRPDHDPDAVEVMGSVLSVMPTVIRGLEGYVRADIVGYQGRVSEYLELLRESIAELRHVDELPPSDNPLFLALTGMCSTLADRLETRTQFFELRPHQSGYATPTGNRIFIIHGQDEAKWRELRDLLEREFKLRTVVLEEEADSGTTIIQKFVKYAEESCYAFALLTPDDFVTKDGKSFFQARPNVLFELGWFYGRFGPERLCIVKKSGTEIPTDLAGIVYVEFVNRVGEGVRQIQKELEQIGALRAAKATGSV